MTERLQKLLANAGLGSRREIEGWIKSGRIRINRKVAQLGDKASGVDRITLDGKPVRRVQRSQQQKSRVIIYNKPEGEICTRNDPQGRPTTFRHLPKLMNGRWIAVGRLDINSQGLMLFTNDGDIANYLMHPSSEIEREYAVRVLGELSSEQMQQLRSGCVIDGQAMHFDDIRFAGGDGVNKWYHVILKEGKKREVRQLFGSIGFAVSRLIRVRFGQTTLPKDLRKGKWMPLSDAQIKALKR